jgi:uncharacterized protein YndB with AHSA1/START domain
MNDQSLVFEAELEAPPERVWKALEDPALSSRWLGEGKVRTTPGERFSLTTEDRRIDCEVIDAEPDRRLRLAWREADGGAPSEVTFVLSPTPAGGTRLRIVHDAVLAMLGAPANDVTPRLRMAA